MIESKIGQRLVGLVLLLLGGGFTTWSWHTAITEGHYSREEAAFFPLFALVGLGLLLFPIDMQRLRAEHGVDRPQKFAHYPLVWKVLCVAALIAALGNWLVISRQ
jgi:hypothetical protein